MSFSSLGTSSSETGVSLQMRLCPHLLHTVWLPSLGVLHSVQWRQYTIFVRLTCAFATKPEPLAYLSVPILRRMK